MNRRIVLASTSPRRSEILSKTDLTFDVIPAEYEEDMHMELAPEELARQLALNKANSIIKKCNGALIIGADTFIVHEGKLLGKPHTPEKAKEMLDSMKGKRHVVLTGLAIVDTGNNKTFSDTFETGVYFRDIPEQEMDEYIATGEPLDKAGAYGIQGIAKKFVTKIEGEYYNVMGLPLNALAEVLKRDFDIVVNLQDS